MIDIIVSGIFLGVFYALISYGLSIIYGVMRIINVSHAAILMYGAYFSFYLYKCGIDPVSSLPLSFIFFFLLGMVIYKGLVKKVASETMSTLLLLFGFSLALQNIALLAFSADLRSLYLPYTYSTFRIGDINVSTTRVMICVISLLIFITLFLFLDRSKLGKSLRAIVQDKEACLLVGINVNRVYMIAFGLGVALTAVAGSLCALIYSFNPAFGSTFMLKAFTIIILGGMESIIGVFLAGILLGLIESAVPLLISAAFIDVINYLILLLILLIRPTGLFGKPRL